MSGEGALPRRERWLVGASLAGIALLAWGYTIYEARRMNATGVCECFRLKMSGPEMASWPGGTLLPLFLMWAIMMSAMMLPSAWPMVMTFAAVSRSRQRSGERFVSISIFVLGYVAVWSLFSGVAALSQWWLHRHALLSQAMVGASAWLGAAFLLAAGIFQFTPLKDHCLRHCRGTLAFIMTRWRAGKAGAFRMGLEHGAFCAGCCWALMGLLFVVGVMNVIWIAALTLLVCVEKMVPARAQVRIAAGVVLIAWGLFLVARQLAPGPF